MESCKRWSFVYIEFIKVINVMLCGIYRDQMIRIIKKSLYRVTLCKNWFKIFIWKNVCITRKTKTIKTRIYERHSEFDWSRNGKIFDWHRKHIYRMLCFGISWYWLLLSLVQSLWNRAWQVAQETWCCFAFTFLLRPSQKTFVTVNAKFG